MAKVTAPLLSMGARGQIGKSAVFAKWRGVAYARQHVTPANPQSADQTTIRSTFALLREMWKRAPAELIAPWNAFATGKPVLGLNKFVGENVRVLKYEADMDNFIGSPGAFGGLPGSAYVSTAPGAAGTFQVAITSPAAPTGWTLVGGVAVAFPQQTPDGIFDDVISVDTTAGANPVLTFAGLTAGGTYVWSAWLEWTKPDGTTAYSSSTTGTQVAHA